MNPFALSGLLLLLTSLILAILSWTKGKKFYNKIWAGFNFAAAIWGLGAFKFSTTLDPAIAFFWLRFTHIGVICIPIFFLHFVFEFLEIKKRKIVYAVYVLGSIFLVLNIMDWLGITRLFIINVRYVFNSFYVDSPPGLIYIIFVGFFFLLVILSFYYCIKHLLKSTGLKRLQIKYFIIGMAVGFGGGGTAFLMVFQIDIYPWPHLLVFLYPIILTYAIMKYRLMDIDLIWRYALSNILYAIIFSLIVISFAYPFREKYIVISAIVFLGFLLASYSHKSVTEYLQRIIFGKIKTIWDELERAAAEDKVFHSTNEVIRNTLSSINKAMNLDTISYFAFLNERNTLLLASRMGNAKFPKNYEIALQKSIISRLNDFPPPIFIDSLEQDVNITDTDRTILNMLNMVEAELVFPINVVGIFTGVLFLGKKKNEKLIHKQDVNKLKNIVKAMERRLAYVMFIESKLEDSEDKLRERIEQAHYKYQKHLVDASKRMVDIKNLDELSKEVVHIMLRSANTMYAAVYLYDAENEVYRKIYEKGSLEGISIIDEIKEDEYLLKLLRDRDKELYFKDLSRSASELGLKDLKMAEDLAKKMGASIIMPIFLERLLGFIVVGENRSKKDFGTNDMNTLHMVSNNAGMVIQNIYVSKNVVRDALTGLYNRGYCEKSIRDNIEKAITDNEHASLLIIDIDFFKKYNDTYGHQQGDDILKLFGQYLKDTGRPTDIPCRYGGEEFAIILPDTNMEGAKIFAERLSTGLKEHKVLKTITLSIGVGTFIGDIGKEDRESLEYNVEKVRDILLKRADDALYKAKDTGRDKVCISEDMTLSSIIGKGIDIQRVLLIEDDEILAETVKNFMQFKGYEIEIKKTGRESLDIAKAFRPDVILLDLGLPDIDGSIVLERLLDMGVTSHIAIFSAYGDRKEEIMKKGAKKFFLKPTDLAEIEAWMKQLS
ncbi:MAG: diguanylate cyclase [Elusimicrobiota bacterium]